MYFEEQGGIELACLIKSFYFSFRKTQFSFVFYMDEAVKLMYYIWISKSLLLNPLSWSCSANSERTAFSGHQ